MVIAYKITTNEDRGSDKKNLVSGFAYLSVPTGNNKAPMTWRQALIEYLVDTTEAGTISVAPFSLPSGITQSQLDAGDIYEWPFNIPVKRNLSVGAFLVNKEPKVISVLQDRLRFWGKEGVTS